MSGYEFDEAVSAIQEAVSGISAVYLRCYRKARRTTRDDSYS